jgi:tetratricopeptide (TPR) repeat protein
MSKKIDKSFFIFSSVAVSGLYQEVLSGVWGFQALGSRLVQKAETAHAFRQFDEVRESGHLLFNLPLKDYSTIGSYFLGVAFNSCGQGDLEEAERMFELAADNAPGIYKPKAILALAALSSRRKDWNSALYFYNEAAQAGSFSVATLTAMRSIAVLKAAEGSHRAAVEDLENLLPAIKHAPPHVYFDYLNSLAVELSAIGRVEEARNICEVVLASPFAPAYTEWQETAAELAEKSRPASRSFVAASSIMPEAAPAPPVPLVQPSGGVSGPKPGLSGKTASVLIFPTKSQDAPRSSKPQAITAAELEQMTVGQKRAMVLAMAYDEAICDEDYDRILQAAGLVKEKEGPNEIDLESESALEQIVVDWCGAIGSEEFARVMSAIRDCEDDLRRVNILDRMIQLAFRESLTGMQSEKEWRQKFEARLRPDAGNG